MNFQRIVQEIRFGTSRSSGPGGQHANKVESRVSLWFDLGASEGLTETEKERIRLVLAGRINRDGCLQLSSQETRSQQENKQRVLARLHTLLSESLLPTKKRVVRKWPSFEQHAARLKDKRRRSELKTSRQKIQS
ncbi:MAG: hypothetical protein RLY31_963 [Bacteroidota bacterium]|jgi:ribosome-associated protein